MASYVFYPSGPKNPSLACEKAELPGDSDALTYAQGVLDRHGSALVVDIWEGDRDVATVRRSARPVRDFQFRAMWWPIARRRGG